MDRWFLPIFKSNSNMNATSFLSIALLATVVTSCNSGIDNSEDKATTQPAQSVQPQQPSATLPASGTSAALNPAHGQPGHTCSLPVGAPLNSTAPAVAPGATAPITLPGNASAQPVQLMPPKGNVNASTARLNPAHGQPGHDCNVPVGQPLK
jgi:hypothetical protein